MDNITHAQTFIVALKTAINQGDKSRILELYDLNAVDWDREHDFVVEEYDELVDQANDILNL
mgnify:CR=1 FL=1